MKQSLAKIATQEGIDILQLVAAANSLKFRPWIDGPQAERLSEKVAELYGLPAKDNRDIEDFLLNDPKAKHVLSRYAGLEPLISEGESANLLKSISQQLIEEMGDSAKKRIMPHHVITILNLGVLRVYRTSSPGTNIERAITEIVVPYSKRLAVDLLVRYYLRQIEVMRFDDAEKYLMQKMGRKGINENLQ